MLKLYPTTLESLSKMDNVLDASDLSKLEQDNDDLNNNLNRSMTRNEIEAVIKIGRSS